MLKVGIPQCKREVDAGRHGPFASHQKEKYDHDASARRLLYSRARSVSSPTTVFHDEIRHFCTVDGGGIGSSHESVRRSVRWAAQRKRIVSISSSKWHVLKDPLFANGITPIPSLCRKCTAQNGENYERVPVRKKDGLSICTARSVQPRLTISTAFVTPPGPTTSQRACLQ